MYTGRDGGERWPGQEVRLKGVGVARAETKKNNSMLTLSSTHAPTVFTVSKMLFKEG